MTAIFGMWNRDGRPIERRLLIGLGATMGAGAPEIQGVWIESQMGMTARLLRVTPESASEAQPALHRSGAVVVFDGRLDNREELLAGFPSSESVRADVPDSALVLAAYAIHGDRMPEMLLGEFALALFDVPRRQLLLARDAIGHRPLYYWNGGNAFLFSSRITAILAHPAVTAKPNELMVAKRAVRAFSQEDQNLTFFDGVSSLPPAHIAVVSPNGCSVKRYWDFDFDRRVRFRSLSDYADVFRHYFEQAVRRCTRSAGPVAVSLSGGLDSSSIFCMAETLRRTAPPGGPVVTGISYGPEDGSPEDESVFVRAIEQDYGCHILRVPFEPASLLEGADEQVRLNEAPFLSTQWAHQNALFRMARDADNRVRLTGEFGDHVLAGQAYLVDLFRQFKWARVLAHLREMPKWATDVSPGAFRDIFIADLARRRLPSELFTAARAIRSVMTGREPALYTPRVKQLAGSLSSATSRARAPSGYAGELYRLIRAPISVWLLERHHKLAASYGMDAGTPFMDRELLSFLLAIPGEVQAHNGVSKALLRAALRGVLPSSILDRRWKSDATDYVNQALATDGEKLVAMLQDGVLVRRAIVKPDIGIQLARWNHDADYPSGRWLRLTDLIALERWHRVFFPDTPKLKEPVDAVAR